LSRKSRLGILLDSQRKEDPMATKKATRKATKQPAKRSSAGTKGSAGFTAEERYAMKERARELKAEAGKANGEADLLAKIADMKQPDRGIAERLHALVKTTAPQLSPRTWYGMPAYAKDGAVLCFFQSGQKFKTRYATFGFSDKAALDDGALWPTGFALKEWNADVEARIRALLKQAIG
jgi:uncharacterized protein YdhG (YjbR/CyaY superfamily)